MSQTDIKSARKRPTMGASTIQVTKTPVGTRMSLGPGMSVSRRSNVSVRSSMPNAQFRPHGDVGKLSKDTFVSIADNRGKEKTQMNELNTKLAGFMENTRFLEATIAALTEELEKWKKAKGFDQSRIRDEFMEELEESRNALADIKKELARLQAENLKWEDKVEAQQEEIDALRRMKAEADAEIAKLHTLLADTDAELNGNRRMIENLEREKVNLKEDILRLQNDNDRVRNDCEDARRKQIELQHELDALNEMRQFECETYEMEIAELKRIIEDLKSFTPRAQQQWKSDFQQMIQAIQDDYNNRIAIIESECKRRYEDQLAAIQAAQVKDQTDGITRSENKNLKSSLSQTQSRIKQLESENARLAAELAALRDQMAKDCEDCEREKDKLRLELEELADELAEVRDDLNELKGRNMSLDMEIACYRKLLEGEERKLAGSIEQRNNIQSAGGAALASIVGGGGSGGAQSSQMSSSMSESSGTIKMQKTYKGAISIKEVSTIGSDITVENTKAKEFDISNWVLERSSERTGKTNRFIFPAGTVLAPFATLKIFSSNHADEVVKANGDIATDRSIKNWGVGSGVCQLLDSVNAKESKASWKIIQQ